MSVKTNMVRIATRNKAGTRLASVLIALKFAGGLQKADRHCAVCGNHGAFLPWGAPIRCDARCPVCGSLERQRLFALWLDQADPHFGRVLHFAPERSMRRLVRARSSDYLAADLDPGPDDVRLDIENIGLPDGDIDTVVCSHVLEHVDDKRALGEIRRVLAPGGLAIIMVPEVMGWPTTYEDPSIVSERERNLYFGQGNHIRMYGADVATRLTSAGFLVDEFVAVEPYVARHALQRGSRLYLCRRPET